MSQALSAQGKVTAWRMVPVTDTVSVEGKWTVGHGRRGLLLSRDKRTSWPGQEVRREERRSATF